MARGPLIILSGPSGSGKSTLIRRAIAESPLPLRLAVSVTTRPPRGHERDGQHYHFWDVDRFRRGVEDGRFLEWAQVHGNYYGTPADEVEPHLEAGTGVMLEIDVQGAAQLRPRYPELVSVFLTAPDYESRLRDRGTEGEEAIRRRLETARRELARADEFDHRIVNDDLDRAVGQFLQVIRERARPAG